MIKYLVNIGTTDAPLDLGEYETFRPEKLVTNVEGAGIGKLTGLYFNGSPQLLGAVDAWLLSLKYEQELVTEFMKDHGLVGKSDDEIDDYLDEHGLSMPQTLPLLLPTLRKGDRVRVEIEGNFKVTMVGVAATANDLAERLARLTVKE